MRSSGGVLVCRANFHFFIFHFLEYSSQSEKSFHLCFDYPRGIQKKQFGREIVFFFRNFFGVLKKSEKKGCAPGAGGFGLGSSGTKKTKRS